MQASRLQIAKYQKAVEDKDALLAENEAKILKLEDDLLDKYVKLKKVNSSKQGQRARCFEHAAKEFEATASSLRDQMISMKEKMSSLSELVEMHKAENNKAYKNRVNFGVSNLKTPVEKLDLIIPYFKLMQALQISRSKTLPTSTLFPSPHGEEAIQEGQFESLVEKVTL